MHSTNLVYRRKGKRVLDLLVAVPFTVFAAPIGLAVAVAIRLDDGGPVFFTHDRVGIDGQRFKLTKFRSMPVGTSNVSSAEATTLTVTRVGTIIRRTSIDEFPQILSVLSGQMSLVGPRPAIPTQTELIEMRRANGSLGLKPGLTGTAQLNAYDGMPEQEKAVWDAVYLKRINLRTDLRILFGTVRYLLRRPPSY